MLNNENGASPRHNDEQYTYSDYLQKAEAACASGDLLLGMHLYLAAFERAQHTDGSAPDEAATNGLKEAWNIACELKERSIAEYAFERLGPFLTQDEMVYCMERLQALALGKLEEFGLSADELNEVKELLNEDFAGLDIPPFMRVEHITAPSTSLRAEMKAASGFPGNDSTEEEKFSSSERRTHLSPQKQIEQPAETREVSADGKIGPAGVLKNRTNEESKQNEAEMGSESSKDRTGSNQPGSDKAAHLKGSLIEQLNAAAAELAGDSPQGSTSQQMGYRDLCGYDRCVEAMRGFGIGMQDDSNFQSLVQRLNVEHGLDGLPAVDALLFESAAREDATRFLLATAGELDLPVLRMAMEENFQGMTVLSVMTHADNKPKLNAGRNMFEGPGVLILENLDYWLSPLVDMAPEEMGGGLMLNAMPRGAREAVALIRSAVENPEVYVLASAASSAEIDPFFLDLLEPLTLIEIDLPTADERRSIWEDIVSSHRSLREIEVEDVVRFTENMPRHDLYMAAREAVEQAYKMSLATGVYERVTPGNFFEKLAAYQPLDSGEYQALEEAAVSSFAQGFDELEQQISREKEGNEEWM